MKAIRILFMLLFVAPFVFFWYIVDVAIDAIVKYQIRKRICKDCQKEFYE